MELKFANDDEKKKGWTLSYLFLNEILQKVEEVQIGDETPSLEQIEDILLVYKKLK